MCTECVFSTLLHLPCWLEVAADLHALHVSCQCLVLLWSLHCLEAFALDLSGCPESGKIGCVEACVWIQCECACHGRLLIRSLLTL